MFRELKGLKVLVVGHNDADGISSAALAFKALREVGAEPMVAIPPFFGMILRLPSGRDMSVATLAFNDESERELRVEEYDHVLFVDCNPPEDQRPPSFSVVDHHPSSFSLPDRAPGNWSHSASELVWWQAKQEGINLNPLPAMVGLKGDGGMIADSPVLRRFATFKIRVLEDMVSKVTNVINADPRIRWFDPDRGRISFLALLRAEDPADIIFARDDLFQKMIKLLNELRAVREKYYERVRELNVRINGVVYAEISARASITGSLAIRLHKSTGRTAVVLNRLTPDPEYAKYSVRGRNARSIAQLLSKLDGSTGEGHEVAAGGIIPLKHLRDVIPLLAGR